MVKHASQNGQKLLKRLIIYTISMVYRSQLMGRTDPLKILLVHHFVDIIDASDGAERGGVGVQS